MAQNAELRLQFLGETQRWGETVLARCLSPQGVPVTVKVRSEKDELFPGLTYSFYGRWTTHYRYGRQFQAKSFVKVQPHDERGVIAYLVQAPHVGPVVAKKLWGLYGSAAVETLRQKPEDVVEGVKQRGFTPERAREAAAYLEQESAIEEATIDLMGILAGKGFPRDTLKRCLKTWGNRAAELVARNAYVLLRFPGCGFTRVDELYLQRGGDPARLKRQALCAWNACGRDSSGSTWFDPGFVTRELMERIGSAPVRPVEASRLAKRAMLITVHRDKAGRPWLTERGRADAEGLVAEKIAWLLSRQSCWPSLEDLDCSPHQLAALGEALRKPVGLFCGSPGTGKTYTAARLIARLGQVHGLKDVAVAAPTGKAAVRITEALEGYGVSIKAKTIHSLLGVVQADEGGFSFAHGECDPLEERFVIVDEASMVDVSLFASLLAALRDDGHLLLVGDVQQLAPVGHGAPLRDLMEVVHMPFGEVTEIRRNAGLIVETCARIRDDEPLELPEQLNPESGGNLVLKATSSSEESAERVIALVEGIRDRGLADPVWEVQVVVAVNEKSALSRRELNQVLQTILNGRNRQAGKFWSGDKVVCLKNTFLSAVEQAMEDLEEDESGFVRTKDDRVELYVANGELGRVVEVFPNRLILEFSAPRRLVVAPFGGEEEMPLDLGYALTCHKTQGSEWPVVIVALDNHARLVCDRSWLYTAISRSKKICFLVGSLETARSMCLRQHIVHRKTFLVERTNAAVEELAKRKEEPLSVEHQKEPECTGLNQSGEEGGEEEERQARALEGAAPGSLRSGD